MAPETANADDYTLEKVDAKHFMVEQQADLVRAKLIALAGETAPSRSCRRFSLDGSDRVRESPERES
jgi:uracil-DNA glycosylase